MSTTFCLTKYTDQAIICGRVYMIALKFYREPLSGIGVTSCEYEGIYYTSSVLYGGCCYHNVDNTD